MKYADILRGEVETLEAERESLRSELDALTEDEARSADDIEVRAKEITARAAEIKTAVDVKLERIGELDALAEERRSVPKGPEFIRKPDEATPGDVRSMTASQLMDTVSRAAEDRDIDPTFARSTMRRHARDQRDENQAWMRNIAARSTDIYTSAWAKYMTGQRDVMSNEERAALAVGTNTQGGYLVPTHLDPTLILSSTGGQDKIGSISTIKTLTVGNVWNGVTSAGVSISWDGEFTEVSDDTHGVDRVSIPLHAAQGFVQASFAAFEDIEGLASDVLMLFGDARRRLLGAAHATGSGSSQPTGIFTALDANTNVEITSTTAATIGIVDLQTVRRAVPERFRDMASWVMNSVYGDAIKNLGTAVSNVYSTDITQDNAQTLLSRNNRVYETDWAPSTQTTTVRDNEIAFGDFSNYYVVEKPGSMSLEFVPLLFNTATNLPDGRRGWYMWFRHGADSVMDTAFRLLQDKTSA